MRFLACMMIVGFLSLPGCALFNKKPAEKERPPGNDPGGVAPARFPSNNNTNPNSNNDPLLNGGSAAKNSGAVLAGRVIDGYSRPPTNTSIKLVSMDPKDATTNDVPVSTDGYFTIQGLKSGTNYKLVARGKNGDRLLAGITYTTAPNVRVLIQVKEDYATSGTPDLPANPAFQGTKPPEQKAPTDAKIPGDPKTSSAGTPNAFAGNMSIPELPPVTVPAKSNAQSSTGWVPGVADKGNFMGPTSAPTLDIPNPTAKQQTTPLQIPPSTPIPGQKPKMPTLPSDSRLEAPARVPSCVLVGKQLVNLALNDINGEPWEFKTSRRGKLILLDFWSTTCLPCRETTPALRQLQSQFGSQGLEVIGIACEDGGSAPEQAYRVNALCQKLQINYRQLLSSGGQCPVRTQFGIHFVPTLVLIDANDQGRIVWHHEGKPDRSTLAELERLIQRKLPKTAS